MAKNALKLLKLTWVAPSFKTFTMTLFSYKLKSLRETQELDLPRGSYMKSGHKSTETPHRDLRQQRILSHI